MLTRADLAVLDRTLRHRMVLSLTVNGEGAEAAERAGWRIAMRHALDAAGSRLASAPHPEREAFASARRRAEQSADSWVPGSAAPAWMGFFTEDESFMTGPVATVLPTGATWKRGASFAPALRLLPGSLPVTVAIADAHRVRICRYAAGSVETLSVLEREAEVDKPYFMSRPARPGFSSGTRGRPGAEAAQRELRKGTDSMLSAAAARIAQVSSEDAWVAVGGIPSVAAALLDRLSPPLKPRAFSAPIDVHASPAEIGVAAREGATRLAARLAATRIEEVLSLAAAHGKGATGVAPVQEAISAGMVRDVYLSSDWVTGHPEEADAVVTRSLESGATVELVGGDAARLLDTAGGIAARLRYQARLSAGPASGDSL